MRFPLTVSLAHAGDFLSFLLSCFKIKKKLRVFSNACGAQGHWVTMGLPAVGAGN